MIFLLISAWFLFGTILNLGINVDPLDLDQLFSRAEVEDESLEPGTINSTMIRCKCGEINNISVPCYCKCGEIKSYWRTRDGKVLKLAQMTVGHITSTIKMLAEKIEQYPIGQRAFFEQALDILYAELGSRGKEMNQLSGIMCALNKSLAKVD